MTHFGRFALRAHPDGSRALLLPALRVRHAVARIITTTAVLAAVTFASVVGLHDWADGVTTHQGASAAADQGWSDS